jgi:renalase
MSDVIVVGAGLAGLTAARQLVDRGADVVVLDKGRSPGGRMATRRMGDGARLDHGAQFFTVRSDTFAAMVEGWPVHVWHHGPDHAVDIADHPSTRTPGGDGHPRYVGNRGMNAITRHLADGLDVRTGVHVTGIDRSDDGWAVTALDASLAASSVLLTAPVPQSLALLPDHVEVPEAVSGLGYDPCVGLLALLDGPPPSKAVQFERGVVHHLADNATKGIAPVPAITVHARGDWSAAHFDDDDDAIAAELSALIAPWIGATILQQQVKRWRYAQPTAPHADRAVLLAEGLAMAGDAFGESRVEGATLSGLAAADLLS